MTVFLIVLIVFGLLILFLALSKKTVVSNAAIRTREIMTPNELEFFHRLTRALPDSWIFPQVAANALLKASGNRKVLSTTRNRFSQKHVDFVVCTKESLQVRAIIELDDKTHNQAKDKARDQLFESAGYTVYRFASKQKPSEQEIAALFYVRPVMVHETHQF